MYNFKETNAPNRHEWVKRRLKDLPQGTHLLDAGAGEQRYRPYCDHLQYTCQDFCEYKPNVDKAGLHHDKWDFSKIDIISDIVSMPVANDHFDAILCTEVFEHISNPIEAIDEFARILKPGGTLLLTAPNFMPMHFAPYCYYTGFTRYFYEKELTDRGFIIESLTANGDFYDVLIQENIRLNQISKRYSNKGLNFMERVIRWLYFQVIDRHHKLSKGSEELLCFGYFIQARKI